MQTYKNLSSVIRQVVTEAHNTNSQNPPFKPDENSRFKKPAGSGDAAGRERAKTLAAQARKAMQQRMKESFDLDITDEEADDLLNSIQEVIGQRPADQPGAKRQPGESQFAHFQRTTTPPKRPAVSAHVHAHDRQPGESQFAHFQRTTTPPKRLGKGDIKEEESEEMKEHGYTAEQHKKRAAEHKENADASKKSGNEVDHHLHMIKFHASMMKAADRMKPPTRGTFKSNEFPD